MTGKNMIVDPQVSGRVTVISSQALASDEVYDMFLSILRVHGYSAVEDGNVWRILPDANARQDGRVPVDEMRGGRRSTGHPGSFPWEHVEAPEISQLLRNLAAAIGLHGSPRRLEQPDHCRSRVQRPPNRDNHPAPGFSHRPGMSKSLPLRHADASDVVSLLKPRLCRQRAGNPPSLTVRTNSIVWVAIPVGDCACGDPDHPSG